MGRSLALLLAVVAGSCARGTSRSGPDLTRPGELAAGAEARALEKGSGDGPLLDRAAPSREAVAAQFGAPRLVAEISSAGDEVSDNDPSSTADLLELYFCSDGRGGGVLYEDLWRSQRQAVGDPWGKPVLVPLSTGSRDAAPAVSPDGLTLAFASNRSGGTAGWDVWISTRPSRGAAWGPAAPATGINSDLDELPGSISDDRLLLLYNVGNSGNTDLRVATRKAPSDLWTTAALGELNTSAFESHPALTANRLAVAFDSDRTGGKGLRDLYLALRSQPAGPFQPPTAIVELNTAANDADPWLSSDLRTIYFARSPVGSTGIFSGPFKLYEAKR